VPRPGSSLVGWSWIPVRVGDVNGADSVSAGTERLSVCGVPDRGGHRDRGSGGNCWSGEYGRGRGAGYAGTSASSPPLTA
jgi:hypothetical protein